MTTKKRRYNALEMTGFVAKPPVTHETRYGPMVRITMGRDMTRRGDETKKKEYFDVLVFGRALETLPELKKGDELTVRGQIRQRSWIDQKTERRQYDINIVAKEVLPGLHERLIDRKEAELVQAQETIGLLETSLKDLDRAYEAHVNGRGHTSGVHDRDQTMPSEHVAEHEQSAEMQMTFER